MKYKLSFYRKVSVFAVFLLLSLSSNVFSRVCMDLTRGSRLLSMLHSMGPAHQIIKDGEDKVIDEDGSYHILENIVSSITVCANNVIIDLNGFAILGSADPIITIKADVENVVIKNGAIVGNCNNVGIKLMPRTKKIRLENLRISRVDKGIHFAGASGTGPVKCCKVTNVHISNATIGVDLDYTEKSIFKNVDVCCSTDVGFDLHFSKFNKFEQCKAIGIVNDDLSNDAIGFKALAGKDNLFFECFAERIAKCDSDFCTKAAGFFFGFYQTMPETESKIINCCVDSIKTTSFGNAFGVCLEMKLRNEAEFVTTGSFDTVVNDIAWSPQGNLIGVGASDPLYGIIDFDGTSLNNVFSGDTNGAVNGVAWSANGRYLASVTDFGEVFVQDSKHDLTTFLFGDFVEADTFYDVRWFNKCHKFVVSGDSNSDRHLHVFFFDGKKIHLVKSEDLGENVIRHVAVSPDDCHIAVGDEDGIIEIRNPDDLALSAFTTSTSDVAINDLDWNPIACCGRYYLAVAGDVGDAPNDVNLEILEYDGASTLTTLTRVNFDPDSTGLENLTSVRWSPRGKDLVVSGTGNTIGVYSFNPQSPTAKLTLAFTYTTTVGAAVPGSKKYVDWSPCGRFIVIAGAEESEQGGNGGTQPVEFPIPNCSNIEVIRVGDSVEKCVVEGNKIANVCGGLCGVGIIGGGLCNLIDKNVVCCAGVPYSWGVYAKHLDGLLGFAGALDNLYGNDCCVCCECECRAPVCDCDCIVEAILVQING